MSKALILRNCFHCQTQFTAMTAHQRNTKVNAYCSRECSRIVASARSSETMAATNRKYASEMMRISNPMQKESVRKKVSATLKRIGHKPKIQGGNGKELPVAHLQLAKALQSQDSAWIIEYAYPTKQDRQSGYPTCYKIDIAHPRMTIAVEVDGFSHLAFKRREQDAKKTQFLNGDGWTVLRFTNAEVTEDLNLVMSTISKYLTTTTTL